MKRGPAARRRRLLRAATASDALAAARRRRIAARAPLRFVARAARAFRAARRPPRALGLRRFAEAPPAAVHAEFSRHPVASRSVDRRRAGRARRTREPA
ncbi:hypothetical protein ACRUK9_29150, partial [Burkholderia pseudomallei]